MKPLLPILLTSLFTPITTSTSLNTYDLALRGLYPRQKFHSTNLEPPALRIDRWDSRCDDGYTFLTPRGPLVTGNARGPMILDNKGELMWMDNEKWSQAMNFQVQRFKGEEFLTFWTKGKKVKGKKGRRSFVMLNSSYEVAYEIRPVGEHLKANSHEFRITPQGTALIALYPKRQTDCTDLHVGKSCWIRDGWFQEIDIETGKLLFEWRASNHISMKDAFSEPCRKDGYGSIKKDSFDWFHLNAIDKTEEGDYLVSARYMHAILCISGKSGEVLWQLGGKKNVFKGVDGALDFAWQHHVTWLGNNTISLFDNHKNSVLHMPSIHSKGMIIHLDMETMTATLLGKYIHPDEILNVSQGSIQLLSNSSNVLVGFGNSPTWVEYTKAGEVLCSTHFAPTLDYEVVDFGLVKSYRIFKSSWVGRPNTVPEIKVEKQKAFVSWSGATEVRFWKLETAKGEDARDDEFEVVQELEKDGFETSFSLDGRTGNFLRVVGLDAGKKVMAYSTVVGGPLSRSAWRWFLLVPVTVIVIGCTLLLRNTQGRSLRFHSLLAGQTRVRLEDDDGDRQNGSGVWHFWRFWRRSRQNTTGDEDMPLLEEPFEDDL